MSTTLVSKLLSDPSRKYNTNFLSFEMVCFLLLLLIALQLMLHTKLQGYRIYSLYFNGAKFLTSLTPIACAGCLWRPASAFVS
jgi:hypothetical protein